MALHHTAQGLASLGRHGDSVLVHMQPEEVAGLQALAKSQGTSLSINPATGMPEAFNLGGFFRSLLPTLVGGAASMIPGMQFASYPLLTGILAGAATGALTNKDPLMGAVTGGLGGYSGAGIMGAGKAAAGAMGSAEAAQTAATNAGIGGGSSGLATGGGFIPGATSGADLAYNNAMMASQAGGVANSAISGASGAMDVEKALAAGRPIGMANTFANTASVAPPPTFLGNMGSAFKGMGGAATGNQAAIDAYKIGMGTETGLGAFGKSMLPVGGAVLGGLEPSDLGFGGPSINELKRQTKYRGPSGQLNLDANYNQDTGEYEGLPSLQLATGGSVNTNQSAISSGGIQDLYGANDNTTATAPLSRDGYGIGRLDKLAQQGSLTKAGDMFYAAGGPVSFADGGDSNKEDEMGLPSLSPDMPMYSNAGADNSAIVQSAMQAMQGMQGNAPMTQGQMPDQSNDSLIAKVTANLMADPNYQPENPIEAAIVQQLKGADPMQQGQPSQQGLGSLGPAQPSQPMAPSYNPSVAMGPTYYAGMNAPRGYADGGEVSNYGQNQASLNLDALPSLNLGNGSSGRSEVMQRLISGFGNLGENHADPKFRTIGNFMSGLLSYDPVIIDMIRGGKAPQGYARGGYLNGPGDGLSDSIPATIEGKQPARLADGEFVVSADVVSGLGNGSSKAGAKHLYAMMDRVRQKAHGTKKQINKVNTKRVMPA